MSPRGTTYDKGILIIIVCKNEAENLEFEQNREGLREVNYSHSNLKLKHNGRRKKPSSISQIIIRHQGPIHILLLKMGTTHKSIIGKLYKPASELVSFYFIQ